MSMENQGGSLTRLYIEKFTLAEITASVDKYLKVAGSRYKFK
jgi:hypothetical protein